jgi:hypothetical protein
MQKFDRSFFFLEKCHFFRRKLSKIAENCDHKIDPRSVNLLPDKSGHHLLLGVRHDAPDRHREEGRVPRGLGVPLVLIQTVLKKKNEKSCIN